MEPINYSLIFNYGIQMMITFAIALSLYTVTSLRTNSAMRDWYTVNGVRLVLTVVLYWFISAGMVVVPNISGILGFLGFNADQGTAAIAFVIAALVLTGKRDGILVQESE